MKRLKNSWILLLALALGFGACQEKGPQTLPILGFKTVDTQGDTVYHQIPSFGFVDQDSNFITEAVTEGKVSVVDFFFTSCPDICPKMKQQMIRLHDEFMDEDRVVLLSHTIDPTHDTVGVLRDFAEALGIESHKWHMFTGTKDSLYAMAKHYMISAAESETAAGALSTAENLCSSISRGGCAATTKAPTRPRSTN
jgi:protein SCO1